MKLTQSKVDRSELSYRVIGIKDDRIFNTGPDYTTLSQALKVKNQLASMPNEKDFTFGIVQMKPVLLDL
jgi:hypothetical protein